jgi:hypothetical protein
MTALTIYTCQREIPYGICPNRSLPGHTPEQARQIATDAGWLLGRDRDLCPDCCGNGRWTR